MDTTTDVLVLGSGPAGLSCAAELGARGVRATVLERGDWATARADCGQPPRNRSQLLAADVRLPQEVLHEQSRRIVIAQPVQRYRLKPVE